MPGGFAVNRLVSAYLINRLNSFQTGEKNAGGSILGFLHGNPSPALFLYSMAVSCFAESQRLTHSMTPPFIPMSYFSVCSSFFKCEFCETERLLMLSWQPRPVLL